MCGTDKEMAIHYQDEAAFYYSLQQDYLRLGLCRQAIRIQHDGLIAAETAMDYMMRHLETGAWAEIVSMPKKPPAPSVRK